ncbi:unnamed protein product [Vitrella brassicaformis CCMP3155]|uniref:Uncharacterized protein n=1 Tax=Vitrella brassicaformis (strain CCMP3155) TaxID=1169540 RepID=A0A0G4FLU8_VITBC|nr:unnamed protein product [Vitrella brassicaformis CCMP3155]|eukprot:CEM14897.1 unnamed protein product [Vitrella brassicaformis CCMP3155]
MFKDSDPDPLENRRRRLRVTLARLGVTGPHFRRLAVSLLRELADIFSSGAGEDSGLVHGDTSGNNVLIQWRPTSTVQGGVAGELGARWIEFELSRTRHRHRVTPPAPSHDGQGRRSPTINAPPPPPPPLQESTMEISLATFCIARGICSLFIATPCLQGTTTKYASTHTDHQRMTRRGYKCSLQKRPQQHHQQQQQQRRRPLWSCESVERHLQTLLIARPPAPRPHMDQIHNNAGDYYGAKRRNQLFFCDQGVWPAFTQYFSRPLQRETNLVRQPIRLSAPKKPELQAIAKTIEKAERVIKAEKAQNRHDWLVQTVEKAITTIKDGQSAHSEKDYVLLRAVADEEAEKARQEAMAEESR